MSTCSAPTGRWRMRRRAPGSTSRACAACGKDYGAAATLDLGRVANENPPKLHIMDGKGNRLDLVEFHPAYHAMMAKSIGHGIHASAHDGSDKPGPVSTRAVRLYLATQAESGHMCPDHHDPCLHRRAALGAGAARQVAAQDPDPHLRSAAAAVVGEERRHARHGHDRAPGRHRRARQHHPRRGRTAIMSRSPATNGSCRRRCAMPSWCSPRRTGGLTCYLMPRYRPDGSQEPDPLPAPEGQARQQVERLLRGRVPRRLCRARRRRGRGRAHHHRDGEPHAARLRHRLGRPVAHCAQPGAEPHPQPLGLPAQARRPAVDARHRGRPGARARGPGRAGVPPVPRLRARRTTIPPKRPTCAC